MIVQACLNGARSHDYHPALPLTGEQIARDAAACVAAGAAELHIHPRGEDGQESLSAVDDTVRAVRLACPGTLIGVSTGAWIEADEERTRRCIRAWRERPDYASVNLCEPDAPGLMVALRGVGVAVEAGLASVRDAQRYVAAPDRDRVLRVLIEIQEQDAEEAAATAGAVAEVLRMAGVRRPVLLHGVDATVWPLIELAGRHGWSTRIGFEDGKHLKSGAVAPGNASLVEDALLALRRRR